MTMVDMNKYLESRGFEVSRRYNTKEKAYIFDVSRNGTCKKYVWKYPGLVSPYDRDCDQRKFLNQVIDTFDMEALPKIETRSCSTCRHRCDTAYCDKECHWLSAWAPNRVDAAMNLAFVEYCKADVVNTMKLYAKQNPFAISKVIFNPPATIVMWVDGEKTVVKAQNEAFDPEKGLAMAIAKKALGNKGNYFEEIKKWVGTYDCEPLYPKIVKTATVKACLENEYLEMVNQELEDLKKKLGMLDKE